MNIKNFLMISMVLFMAPNFVFAQDNDEATDVEEIIVTATKRETNLMETPLAVSVITQEQMALQGLSRISDLSSLVPNLVVGNSGEDSGVSIAIRDAYELLVEEKKQVRLQKCKYRNETIGKN